MKTLFKVLFVAGLLISAGQISAQDIGSIRDAAASMGDQVDVSTAISQIAGGIKPEAFKKGFDMTDWKAKLPELNPDDLAGMKNSLNSLIGGLKGSSFIKGAKSNIMKGLAGLNGKADVSKLLGDLVNGLKPEMLTEAFAANKDKLLQGLKMVK